MQAYLWIKTAHVVFVMAWMGGVFYLPRILVNLAEAGNEPGVRARLLLMGRRLYRFGHIMSPKTIEAARKGLPNTLYGVSLRHDDEVIGMGRIIGDGGCFYTVVDIAVAPPFQGRGLGKRIMAPGLPG